MPFPLLRLPYVALLHAIRTFGPFELIFLSQCSSKTSRLVKNVPIRLTIFETPYTSYIFLQGRNDKAEIRISMKPLEGPRRFLDSQQNIPVRYSKDSMMAEICVPIRKIIDFSMETFKVKLFSYSTPHVISRDSSQILKLIKNFRIRIEKVIIGGSMTNEEVALEVMESCSTALELRVQFHVPNFEFNEFHKYSMDFLKLEFIDCYWFTSDHLCALINCSSVVIKDCALSSPDLNIFIRHWLESSGRLNSLELRVLGTIKNHDNNVMFAIDHVVLENSKKYQIQRADGIRAEITLTETKFILKVVT